jgi:probable HAF family extracellular repeat protein
MLSRRGIALLSALTALVLVPAAGAQTYTITDLGTFPGGTVSEGYGVSGVGQVVGYARISNYDAHGFIWSERAGLRQLSSIPPQTNFGVAQAINSSGVVAGYSDYNELLYTHAVLWIRGVVTELGTFAGGRLSEALGINDSSQVTGFSDSATNSPQAFLWSSSQGMQDLGTLPGGYYSQGLAINAEGEVAGFSNASDGAWHAFLWSASTGMQALPNAKGASSASGNGINNLGQVAGGSGNYAILWDSTTAAENMGVLPGQTWSTAFAVNDAGEAVGWSGFRAFVWNRAKGIQDLNDLIPANSGWFLSTANAINASGQITGQGTISGQQHAFLLTPVSH